MISTKILSKQFDAFAKKNSLNVKKNWSYALSALSLDEDLGIQRDRNENVCLSDEVNDEDIVKLFNAFESSRHETLDTIKNSSSNDQIDNNNKTLTFNLPFNRIKNLNEHRDIHHGQENVSSNPLKSFHNGKLIDESFQLNGDNKNLKEERCEQQPTINNKRRWIRSDSNAIENRFHNSRTDNIRAFDVNQDEQQELNTKRYISDFRSGNDELQSRYEKKNGTNAAAGTSTNGGRKSLGGRRTVQSQFVPPFAQPQQQHQQQKHPNTEPLDTDDRLKHIDPKMVELIRSEIMHRFSPVCMYYRL